MADETGLQWVDEPQIKDGYVVYKYRNSAETDATFVGESVNIMPTGANNTVQSFSLDALAVGAEQETHAPAPTDLPDGPVSVFVEVQSASTGGRWDGELNVELRGVAVGGVLKAANEAPAQAGGGTFTVDIADAHLDGDELVLHYRVKGDAHLDVMSIGISLFDPQGGTGWMQSFGAEADREDIFRARIPFDEVLGTDAGWAIEASVMAGELQSGVTGAARARIPVERVDDTVVAPSGFTVEQLTT